MTYSIRQRHEVKDLMLTVLDSWNIQNKTKEFNYNIFLLNMWNKPQKSCFTTAFKAGHKTYTIDFMTKQRKQW